MNFLEKIYLFLYKRKKCKCIANQNKLPFPVVSIGNLTLGGTGKTPFTIELAKEAMKRGFNPIILTRGYKGKLKGPLMVTPANKPEDVGDEPLLLAEEGLKVFKGIDRYEAGVFAIEKLKLRLKDKVFFILDDGFQHWRLHRNVEILLIDGINGFGNYKLFPLGPLRSPLEEVNLADMVFITKKENTRVKEELMSLGVKVIYDVPIKILGLKDRNGRLIDADGKTAFVFAGIGNFESFLESLKELNLEILGYRKFIDHKFYTKRTIQKLLEDGKGTDLFITTKKDFIKLKNYYKDLNDKLCYLQITLEIPTEAMEKILMPVALFYSTSS